MRDKFNHFTRSTLLDLFGNRHSPYFRSWQDDAGPEQVYTRLTSMRSIGGSAGLFREPNYSIVAAASRFTCFHSPFVMPWRIWAGVLPFLVWEYE